jgi:hypothetical protein
MPDATRPEPESRREDRLPAFLLDDSLPLEPLVPGMAERLVDFVLAVDVTDAHNAFREGA